MIGKVFAAKFLVFLLLVADAPSVAQDEEQARKEEPAVQLKAELVLVPVEVVNKKSGLPVGGLKEDDFVVFEDGMRQEISFFGQEDIPLRIIIVAPSPISCSSPSSQHPLPLSRCEAFVKAADRARRLAGKIVDSLRPGDSVALFTVCGGDLTMVLPFTDDLAKVRELLQDMKAQCPCERGAIVGLDRLMLMEVAKYTSQYSGRISHPIIPLINENFVDPHRPEFPLKELVAAIINSGATICAIDLETPFGKYIAAAKGIGIGTGIGYFRMKNKFFSYFTDLTGGLVVKDDTEKPELAVQEIMTFFERVRRSYIIGFKPNGGRSKGRLVKIKVELSPQARKKNKDAQLRHRQGYIVAAGEGGRIQIEYTEWEQPGALTQSK